MMNSLKSSLKTFLKNSRLIPAVYTFFTAPLQSSLRHLEKTPPQVPQTPEKISVIIPNYNYSAYLEQRVNSILNQTYPISELTILDDASTDDSQNIINDILNKTKNAYPDIKFRFLPNQKNTGKSIAQWQKGFKTAAGNFIWLAEADDSSDPNFLATVMEKFKRDKNVVLSFSNSVAINQQGETLLYDFQNHSVDKEKTGHWATDYLNDGQQEIKHYLSRRCTIPNVSAVVFKNDKTIPFQKYLEEAKQFAQVGDWYFYLKVLKHGKIAYSRPSLNFFRIHQGSITANSNRSKSQVHAQEIQTIRRLCASSADEDSRDSVK